jgi:hypothetical protein
MDHFCEFDSHEKFF